MKKVAELTGAELDYWVAKGMGLPEFDQAEELVEDGEVYGWHYRDMSVGYDGDPDLEPFMPSLRWSQGGPIIEREGFDLEFHDEREFGHTEIWWEAYKRADVCTVSCGPTPLIAAMRAYVASKFGDEVGE